ncbi:hypothetical protein HDU77_008280 [Chytriomyces hyalinus]|nr:hypothetical protein HDU77_008280 [Chytriomyces hyalinus]
MSQEPDPPILKLMGNAGILGNSILIQPCTASIQSISRFALLPRQVCDANIMSAFLWTLEKVHSMLPTLSARIEQDMAQQRIAWDREKEEQRKRVEAARLKATSVPEERVSSMQAAELRKVTTTVTAAIPADLQHTETQLRFPNERDSSISVNTEPLSHESEDLVSFATPMPTIRKDTVDSATAEENTSRDILEGAVALNDEDNLHVQTSTMEPDSLIQGLNQQVRAVGESSRKEQGKHESLFPLPPPRPEALSGTVKRSPRPTSSKKTSGKTKRKQIPQSQQHQIQRKQQQVDKTGAVDAVDQLIEVESTVNEKQPNEVQPKRTDVTDLDEYKLPSAEIISKSKTSPTLPPTTATSTTSDTSAPIIPISLAAAAMSRKILLPPIGKSGTTAAAAEVTSLGKSLDTVSGPAGRKEGLSDVRDSAVCVVE